LFLPYLPLTTLLLPLSMQLVGNFLAYLLCHVSMSFHSLSTLSRQQRFIAISLASPISRLPCPVLRAKGPLSQAEWSSAHHTSGTCRKSPNFVPTRTRTRTIQLHHWISITGPRRIALLLLGDLRKVPSQLAFVCDKCAVIMDGPDRQKL